MEDYNRRFGKTPYSNRNAHRALLSHEKLRDICQWREERKVSRQLTLNYRRVMYLLEPTEAAKKTEGRRVQVYEDEAGNIEIRDGSVTLSARRFERVPGAPNGAVVENKTHKA